MAKPTVSQVRKGHIDFGGTFFHKSHMKANGETLKSFRVEQEGYELFLVHVRTGKRWVVGKDWSIRPLATRWKLADAWANQPVEK